MLSNRNDVKRYFDSVPLQWDSLYSRDHSVRHFFNRVFRRAMFERFELTFAHCGEISGMSVLDVGCGTGQYSMEFARRGAARVVGLDFSSSMIDFCRSAAEQRGISHRCEFICDDFESHPFQDHFDIVIAIGFFDYVDRPATILRKVAALTKRRFLASFPSNGFFWRFHRSVRYAWIKGCPVHEYSAELLDSLYKSAGFPFHRPIRLTRGIFMVAGQDGRANGTGDE
jgi:SAM-dependent methyltransferase